jgi:hypothetical protein
VIQAQQELKVIQVQREPEALREIQVHRAIQVSPVLA